MSDGIFNEIFYPRLDQACIRDLGLIVTNGAKFFSKKKRDADHKVKWLTKWGLNLVAAATFLTFVGVLGRAGTFWLYGVIAVGSWVFIYLLVPETKGKTLEQIEAHWRARKHPRTL